MLNWNICLILTVLKLESNCLLSGVQVIFLYCYCYLGWLSSCRVRNSILILNYWEHWAQLKVFIKKKIGNTENAPEAFNSPICMLVYVIALFLLVNILLATARTKWYAWAATIYIKLKVFHICFIILRNNGNATTSAATVLTSMSELRWKQMRFI